MRLANVRGRAVLVTHDDRGLDVEGASNGKFGPDPSALLDDWEAFRTWAEGTTVDHHPAAVVTFTLAELDCPSPRPRQVIAIGLNYRAHAMEAGFAIPDGMPPTFTKFPSCLAGAETEVVLPHGGDTDWEVELVVVIGKTAHKVDEASAWSYVAGLAVGQDISERISQTAGPSPQFSLGKSFTGFGPVGPWLVTPDSLESPDDLPLQCLLDGDVVQDSRTSDLIMPVTRLISELSNVLTLSPGDLIFTGTPAGVGMGRTPKRFLEPGERLVSRIGGIGEIVQTFVAPEGR